LEREEWIETGQVIRTISTTYDFTGRILSLSDPSATYQYAYDDLGRVSTVTSSGNSGIPAVTLTYTYKRVSDHRA